MLETVGIALLAPAAVLEVPAAAVWVAGGFAAAVGAAGAECEIVCDLEIGVVKRASAEGVSGTLLAAGTLLTEKDACTLFDVCASVGK